MLHKTFKITQIALRYYKIKHPKRKYSNHYAVKQWRQDSNIDRDVLKVVINKVFEEQNKMLKK